MDATTETRREGTLPLLLAGLQGGMVGGLWMLAWLGLSATWQRRSFWTAENLFASAFYGDTAIRRGFAFSTLSGLALYLLLYSLLGAGFAAVVRDRVAPTRVMLLAILFSLFWYFVSFHGIWKSLLPLVYLLHAEKPAVIGHLLYGTFLGRYPEYLKLGLHPAATLPVEPVPSGEPPAPQ
jgi:hypothetical protein